MSDKHQRGYHHATQATMGQVNLPPTALSSLSLSHPQEPSTEVQDSHNVPPPPPPPKMSSGVTIPPPRSTKSSKVVPPPPTRSSVPPPPTSRSAIPPVHSTPHPSTAPAPTPPSVSSTPSIAPSPPVSAMAAPSATLSVPPASSSFMRYSTGCFPGTSPIASKWTLPTGCMITPFPESSNPSISVPRINLGKASPLRCTHCRTYVNPYFEFHDGGRRFVCNICKQTCETDETFIHRLSNNPDLPELGNSVVEFSASSEYTLRPPQAPAYLFLIDVTAEAFETGFVEVVCNEIKENLDKISGDERTMFSIIAFDSRLRFFKFSENSSGDPLPPQEFILPDVEDMFIPSADGLLVNFEKHKDALISLLDYIPLMNKTSSTDVSSKSSCLGSAVVAGASVIGHNGGKIMLFGSSRPDVGSFSLEHRERKYENQHGNSTSHLHELIRISNSVVRDVAVQCCRRQITVDVFALSKEYVDVSSLGYLAKSTGGTVTTVLQAGTMHSFNFDVLKHGVLKSLSSPRAWEAVLRVRSSDKAPTPRVIGHLFQGHNQLTSIPVCGEDSHVAVVFPMNSLANDIPGPFFHIQIALLATSCNGERLIRVINGAVPIKNNLAEMYKEADVEAIVALTARCSCEAILSESKKISDVRDDLIKRVVALLATYRSNVRQISNTQSTSQLVLPEKLRLLPVLILALLKSPFLRLEKLSPDKRSQFMYSLLSNNVNESIALLHPTMIALHEYLKTSEVTELEPIYSNSLEKFLSHPISSKPAPLRLSNDYVKTSGIYLVVAPTPVVFIGDEASQQLKDVLFERDPQTNKMTLTRNTFEGMMVRKIISNELGYNFFVETVVCTFLKDMSQHEFFEHIIESKNTHTAVSYIDFLTLLHKNIRSKLSA
ncbi:hypothetical protein GEMRC1_001570 [Eukaryota sp. GEM-RC1]